MKKLISFIIAILMLLSAMSCSVDSPVIDNRILSSDDIEQLNTEDVVDEGITLTASEGAYIRSGKYANTIPAELPKTDFYYIKNDGVDTTRHVVLKFDISGFDIPENTHVSVVVNFFSISPVHESVGGTDITLKAYKEMADWNSKSVTFSTFPALSEDNYLGAEPLIKGDVFIDITDYVKESKANGEKVIAIRLVPSARTVAEMRICPVEHKLAPKLVAKKAETREFYQPNLLVDENANREIWDYAKKTYDEWKSRYDQIVAKGDYPSSTIGIDKTEYTFTTTATLHETGETKHTFDTRLINTLNGFDESAREVELDRYGGIISDTRFEATGYFYTKKIGDRWITVDPLGYPCHITGINHTYYAYSNSKYQTKAMSEKFGTSEKWAISTTRWLKKDLGFNVALGTPHELLSVQNGAATTIYTPGIGQYASSVGLNASEGGTTQFLYNGTMPVFDPGFKAYIEEKVPDTIAKYANNPYVIGYISDNELPVKDSMLTDYLTLDPSISANLYSYACAWTWIIETTGKKGEEIDIYSIDKLNEESKEDLFVLFKGFIYDKYFSVIQPVIKAACPNQLYLGVRMLTGTEWGEWVARVDGYWCDIMCINYYGAWEVPTEQIENLQKWTGKPIMITEFYAKGSDAIGADGKPFTNADGAGWICKTQTERGYFYQNFTLRLLEAKNCVGWLYFQYIDNDPTDESIEKGQSNSNKGIVDSNLDREVYKAYHSQIASINLNKYELIEHFDGVDYFK